MVTIFQNTSVNYNLTVVLTAHLWKTTETWLTLKNVLDDNEPITEKIVINRILHSIIDILSNFLKYFFKSLFNAPKGVT